MPSARAWRLLALALLVSALAVGAWGVATGQLRIALLLIFPIVYGTGGLGLLAILLLVAATFAWFAANVARFREAAPEGAWAGDPATRRAPGERDPEEDGAARGAREERRVKHGGVVLLGPFPIVWGSDAGMAKWAIVGAIALMVLAFLFLFAAR